MPSLGVISDTHGLLRAQALEALRGVDLIVHAGDIGSAEVIAALQELAPVVAVRGNVDEHAWAKSYPLTQAFTWVGRRIYLLHNIRQLELDPAAAGFELVIYGHSHKPECYQRDAVTYLNPGSAGRRRFKLPVALARVSADSQGLNCSLMELDV